MENLDNTTLTMENYRILYQLYAQHKSGPQYSLDMWPLIVHNYNFLTKSKYNVDEIKRIWIQMPAMLKRKFMLDSFTTKPVNDEINKKVKRTNKKNTTKDHDTEKVLMKSILKVQSSQKEPYDFSNKENLNQPKVSFNLDNNKNNVSTIENLKNTKMEKCTQTETDMNELNYLAKKESLLKVLILELKLKYMQEQYKNLFE